MFQPQKVRNRVVMETTAISNPKRIVLIRPCCIGDAVMATAALSALRETYPDAHISWVAGPWSARAIAHHPALDEIVDTGVDMPLKSVTGFMRLVGLLRAGNYDMAISLVRSPLMSLAARLSEIPVRAGLDSGGRGFGYNLRVPVDPDAPEHESEIYLRVVSAGAGREVQAYANLPVTDVASETVRTRLESQQVLRPFIVAHPGGGVNPGARFEVKRFPLQQFAEMLNRVAKAWGASVILLGGPGDAELVAEVARGLKAQHVQWVDRLAFPEIGALAAQALVYIGNDSGLTHLAAASGAKTVMLMGPTDPRRYAPYAPGSIAVCVHGKQVTAYSVSQTNPLAWQDICVSVESAVKAIVESRDK
jgi:ADP-heptose:LPS heptosyltransferase